MKQIILIFLLVLFSLIKLSAQDLMVMRNKNSDTLKVKVYEISNEVIKYKLFPIDTTMPVFVESKSRIRKIIFQNNKELKFYEDDFSDPNFYTSQKKSAIKITPFSILLNYLAISYEKSIKPGVSYETTVGLIGAGLNREILDGPKGAFFKAGYKFINRPDYHMNGMRYSHILKGSYFKPELVGVYYENSISKKKIDVRGWSAMFNFGKQWVYDDFICVDIYVGLGIGKKTQKWNSTNITTDTYLYPLLPYGFITVPKYTNESTLCYNAGLKVGFLLGN